MRKLYLLLATVVISAVALGQTTAKKEKKVKTNVSIGMTAARASGDISDTHSAGFGGIGQIMFKQKNSDVSYVITTGVLTFRGKDSVADFTQMPILVGFRYHYDVCYSGLSMGTSIFDQNRGTQFTYSLLMGFNLSKAVTIDGRYLLASKEHKNIASFNITLSFCL